MSCGCSHHAHSRAAGPALFSSELVVSLVAGAFLAIAWSAEQWGAFGAHWVIGLYLVSYVLGAFEIGGEFLAHLWKGRFRFDIDLLMLLAAVGAALLGAWAEGAFLLFLFSLAHALEHFALDRARHAIRGLSELFSPLARVLGPTGEREIPVEEVKIGDVVVVRPGERIPIDGRVRLGTSSIDQSPITGESIPVLKSEGDEVFAGTINGDGAIEVTTVRAVGDRTLDRVIKLVEAAQAQKAPTQHVMERFERVFVPAVLFADLAVIFLPPLTGLWDWHTSFYRAMSLLVAASPCALALGTPSAVLAGIAQAARNGVLIKGGAHLESLGQVAAIAFDKTGTLTLGRPEVVEIVPASGSDEETLLRIAASAEQRSQHPLAQAVVRIAAARGVALVDAGELTSSTGRGIHSSVDGAPVEIGNLRFWEERAIEVSEEIARSVGLLESRGRSTMAVRWGEQWLGVLGLADMPRPEARASIAQLHAIGIGRIVMLSGDNQRVAEAIGADLGVDAVHAGLLPEDKAALLRQLLSEHRSVAMVGDGINDAPALAAATVGIAMGGAGTAVALETADVALMGDKISVLPFAIALSRQTRAVIRQNIFIALAVIVLLIIATLSGTVGMGPAVVAHEGSTLVVILNALRLLSFRGSRMPVPPASARSSAAKERELAAV